MCSNLRDAAENAEFIFEAASENIRIKKAILKGKLMGGGGIEVISHDVNF